MWGIVDSNNTGQQAGISIQKKKKENKVIKKSCSNYVVLVC
jgi:hypothetical protein